MFSIDDIKYMRDVLVKELKSIKNYNLADRVELLKDEEVKDILLKVFIENYKKEHLC